MPLKRKRGALADEAASSSKDQTKKSAASVQAKKAPSLPPPETEAETVGALSGDSNEATPSCLTFTIPAENGKAIPCQLHDHNPSASSSSSSSEMNRLLIFTHGASGGVENPATKLFAQGCAASGTAVLCFQGAMNLQSRAKTFGTVLEYCRKKYTGCEFALGGRSMGARAAVLLAQEHEDVTKLALVSYPLTSPKGDVRDRILLDLPKEKEVCFVSGDRDNMCEIKQLNKVRGKMVSKSKVVLVRNGDHGMSLVGSTRNKADGVEKIRMKGGEVIAHCLQQADPANDQDQGVVEMEWNGKDGKVVIRADTGQEDDDSAERDEETTADEVDEPSHEKGKKLTTTQNTGGEVASTSKDSSESRSVRKRRKPTETDTRDDDTGGGKQAYKPRRSNRIRR